MYTLLIPTALIFMLLTFILVIFNINTNNKEHTKAANTNNDYKGLIGELQLYSCLKELHFEKELYKNVYAGNAEIDLVMLTRKGLFVFEMKNRAGSIFGRDDGKDWIQRCGRDTENSFYNPINQNAGHIRALKYHLNCKSNIKIFSYIVLGYSCEYLDVQLSDSTATVALIQDVNDKLTSHYNSHERCINEKEYNHLKLELAGFVQLPEQLNQRYIANG